MPSKKIFLSLFLTIFFFTAPAYSDSLSGEVVRIIDGDTVVLLDQNNQQHKIRLQGIDAPERKQPFGKKSKVYLSNIVAGKKVTVEYTKQNRYSRIIGKIILNDIDINIEQVKVGLAWHYKKYQGEQSEKDRVAYAQAEIKARENQLGLWIDPHAVEPWEWRKKKQ